MRTAFEILGYKPFHESRLRMDKNLHLIAVWVEVMQARYYGTCEVYGRRE